MTSTDTQTPFMNLHTWYIAFLKHERTQVVIKCLHVLIKAYPGYIGDQSRAW